MRAILQNIRQPRVVTIGLILLLSFGRTSQAQNNPAGAIFGGFGAIVNQAIQQQQQQQQFQQQQILRQQQLQYQQQQMQQQQLQLEQQRQAAREYQLQQEQARERAAARRRQEQAAREAAQERARAEAEARAKAEEEARLIAASKREEELKVQREEYITSLVVQDILGSATEDISVLVVARDTPRVMRNLSGDPVFAKAAALCFPFGSPSVNPSTAEGRLVRDVLEKIKKRGGGDIIPKECSAESFGQFDLLLFIRSQVESERTDPNRIRPVLAAIQEGAFVKFGEGVYRQTDFINETEGRRRKIEDDERQRRAERDHCKEGFDQRAAGIISVIFTRLPAPAACVVGSADSLLAQALKRDDSPFTDVVSKTSVLRYGSPNEAFLDLKRQDCYAVVADTKTLKEIVVGLEKAGIQYDVHCKSVVAAK